MLLNTPSLTSELNRRGTLLGLSSLTLGSLLAVAAKADSTANTAPDAYIPNTLKIGMFSLEISHMAKTKAASDRVRQFAVLEEDEQAAVGSILLPIIKHAPKRPENLEKTFQELEKMQSGPAFDQLYIETEIAGHQALLPIQRPEAKQPSSTPQAASARILVAFIHSHLYMLAQIKKSL
ncbi:DUF4142 domain-containing protein [Flexibacterium corallicola]|uniref:DUF4142 domain-containing protein n=1 Tax=Flexibacterium corallicola TaxID=3037259 RepID=UPI00286F92D9|nr:DUF4142 domain-containing protein [Pseudovibrio sp. M1P-2-3]